MKTNRYDFITYIFQKTQETIHEWHTDSAMKGPFDKTICLLVKSSYDNVTAHHKLWLFLQEETKLHENKNSIDTTKILTK